MTYNEVMSWFCDDGMGFGQIMLALQPAEITEDPDDDAPLYLERRADGEGWGEIWQDLELIGRSGDERAGPPEEVGPPEEPGPPEEAGPPEGAGRP